MDGSWKEGIAGSQFAWGGSWGKGGLLGTGYGILRRVDDQFNGLGAMFVIPVVKQADPQAGERNLLSNRRVGGGSQSHGGFGLAGRNLIDHSVDPVGQPFEAEGDFTIAACPAIGFKGKNRLA